MDGVTEFNFIDIFEGLEHQGIRKNILKFVGIDAADFGEVELLRKEEYEHKAKLIRSKKSRCDAITEPNYVTENKDYNGSSIAGSTVRSQALNHNGIDSTLTKIETMIKSPIQFQNNTTNELSQESYAVTSQFDEPPFEFSHPTSEPAPEHPSSIYDELISEGSFTHILSDSESYQNSFSTIPQDNMVDTRPLSNDSDNAYFSQPYKKIKSNHIFRPVSSEAHILTSDQYCLEF